jgi:hypothetical protein
MIDGIEKLWNFFMPARVDPLDVIEVVDVERLKKINSIFDAHYWWRIRVSLTLFVGILLTTWSFSPFGFVRAADFTAKAEDSIKQLKTDVQAIKAKTEAQDVALSDIKSSLNELVAQKVATDICRALVRLRAEPDPQEKSSIRAESDAYQRRYRALTAEYYPEDRCK